MACTNVIVIDVIVFFRYLTWTQIPFILYFFLFPITSLNNNLAHLFTLHVCFCLTHPSASHLRCHCSCVKLNIGHLSLSQGPVPPSAAMSAKAISEQTGKEFLYKFICTTAAVQNRFRYASVTSDTDWDRLTQEHQWLLTEVRLLQQAKTWVKRVTLLSRLLVSLVADKSTTNAGLCWHKPSVQILL